MMPWLVDTNACRPTHVLTFNGDDFRRFHATTVVAPGDVADGQTV